MAGLFQWSLTFGISNEHLIYRGLCQWDKVSSVVGEVPGFSECRQKFFIRVVPTPPAPPTMLGSLANPPELRAPFNYLQDYSET